MQPQPLLVCGNWKMHTDRAGARALAQAVRDALARPALAGAAGYEAVVFPPFPFLADVVEVLGEGEIGCGAQCCHWAERGAYTGAVSAPMVASTGCGWVLVGHSERRRLFGERDEEVGKQLRAALAAGLRPILCVGETLEEREAGRTHEVVATQLRFGLEGVSAQQTGAVVIAYEPVWAIGTGRSATVAQAKAVHDAIRALLPGEAAAGMRVLYGGSVKPDNAYELLACPGIDGVLVGGASLDADAFAAIAEHAVSAHRRKSESAPASPPPVARADAPEPGA